MALLTTQNNFINVKSVKINMRETQEQSPSLASEIRMRMKVGPLRASGTKTIPYTVILCL